ncbi:N-formylglutamate amidohydrolase [Dehalococcoidia bacterium]|nr:N-formylglutamate amidohydrolase [Dehalococcoidia bacterium]
MDDAGLDSELLAMTDLFTDQLFGQAGSYGATLFINRVSRLVMDPERFPDDQDEPMSAKGMGAIYTKTSQGGDLRPKWGSKWWSNRRYAS